MTLGMWVLLGIAVGLVYLFLFILLKAASDSDRASRHLEKNMAPWSDVVITHIEL